jgi:hypothetical protein
VLSEGDRRNITIGVFVFGACAGLWSCNISVTLIEPHDTIAEDMAFYVALLTPTLACIAALWSRHIVGWSLVSAGLFFIFGVLHQHLHQFEGFA